MAVLLCFALFCFALLYCFALLSYSAFWSFFLNRRLLPPLPFPPSPRWTYPSVRPPICRTVCLSICLLGVRLLRTPSRALFLSHCPTY
ncbi:hypothetical protein HDK77DRAFT_456469 [Phyllosticta capitalensis]